MRWFLDKFWNDPTFFAKTCRGCIAVLGAVVASGKLPIPEGWDWLGLLVVGAAQFINAGEKNLKVKEGADAPKSAA